LKEFDYHLPREMIAQRPAFPRDSSRLLVLRDDRIEHCRFSDLETFLSSGDLMVLNKTKVLPARFWGWKGTGGKVSLLLVRKVASDVWECLSSGARLREGSVVVFEGLNGTVVSVTSGGRLLVSFSEAVETHWEKIGEMPTPPYIKEPLVSADEYQTVFAKEPGSIAAPTAGLHFTEEMLGRLAGAGIVLGEVLLHVGTSTFLPVKEDDVTKHAMDPEYLEVDSSLVEQWKAVSSGSRLVVGTTTLKALETAAQGGELERYSGESSLFIYPGHEFKARPQMFLTNFHLPRSTNLLMVCAFAGKERVLNAYNEAVEKGYRFYSFGDAMLIMGGSE